MSKHIIDDYIDMEEKLDLYSKQVKGFYYWLYVREELYTQIISKRNNSGEGFRKTNIFFSKMPKLLFNCITNRKYKMKEYSGEYDILFCCHPRRILEDGEYISSYTDLYSDKYTNSITIEYPHEGMHYIPSFTQNIYYLDRMFYYRAIFLKFCPDGLTKKDKQGIEKTLKSVASQLQERFGYELSIKDELQRIIYLYKRYRITKKYFNKMLSTIKPKKVVEVVYYRFENMVLNEVLRDKSIPVIELQHGLTGRYHIAYNYGSIEQCNTLPNYFLSFADYWTQNMRLPGNLVKVKSSGFAFFEKNINSHPKKQSPSIILFISSGTVGDELSMVAIDLNRLLETSKLKVVYKLHPGEFADWKTRYPELLASSIKVIDDANTNLYDLFANSIAQVGVYSTAIFEGLGYDLKTFVLARGEIEHVECLLNLGYAKLAKSAEEIYSDLLMDEKNHRYNSSIFWRPQAFKNVCAEIDNV